VEQQASRTSQRGLEEAALGVREALVGLQCRCHYLSLALGAWVAMAKECEEALRLRAAPAPRWTRPEVVEQEAAHALVDELELVDEQHLREEDDLPEVQEAHDAEVLDDLTSEHI
jgi:hypothetical protein